MVSSARKWMLAAVISALPCAASAQVTGTSLREYCDRYPLKSETTSLCIGYIWGSIETARKFKIACEPPGVLGPQFVEMTRKHMQKYPDQLSGSAADLILNMYKEQFPCR